MSGKGSREEWASAHMLTRNGTLVSTKIHRPEIF